MADQADVMDYLEATASAACFPNGTSQPSVTARVIGIGQGWPEATDVDAAIAAGKSLVSIYAIASSTAALDTPFDWNPGTVSAPIPGMSVVQDENELIVTGQPGLGEVLTIIINGSSAYSVVAGANDTNLTVTAALASEIASKFPGTAALNGVITISGAYAITGRITIPATVGQIIHRQRQNFQITVWAPTPADRSTIAQAIDLAIKNTISVPMPDTSTAVIVASGSNLDDKRQETSGYHRALIYTVQWDTVNEYPGHEITSINIGFEARGRTAAFVQ